ncbi:GL22548 [Drosophila persimilis]|uniref:alkaline phosphatase n=1 Tax=Drosophila persimilis TaxID=7234 RepID=B4H148_DROPE|nr:GL22548 [Drosophila persimilis]
MGPERVWNLRSVEELKSKEFWFHDAQRTLFEKLSTPPNQYVAKNVIFFLGDGMSVPTVTASRIFEGQLRGVVGERNRLEFEKFNFVGLSKTYCVNKQVSDSACTASAYLSGIKANYLTIGVTPNVQVNDCAGARLPQNRLSSIAAWAMKGRKSAGVVTTTRITHASPAGVYAHTSNRDFESDFDAKKALDETVQFSNAIKKARLLTNPWDTLIVVTADHGHTVSISGYPDVNNSIAGLNSEFSDVDSKPYATLSYANGPEFQKFYQSKDGVVERVDLTTSDIGDKDARYPHGVPMSEETHGGGDVAVYAHGPWAHLFTGVYEQNTIPFMMGYASCLGPGMTYCDLQPKVSYNP